MLFRSSPADPLLEAFLKKHYHFYSALKYQGIAGRLRARKDRKEVEAQDAMMSGPCENIPANLKEITDSFVKFFVDERQILFSGGPGLLWMAYNKLIGSCRFSEMLAQIMYIKGLAPADVYKAAHVDRKLFSKIQSDKEYRPSKKTVLALCIGLEANAETAEHILQSCGFCLSRRILSDVIVEYFIRNGIFNIPAINASLAEHGLDPLME